MLSYAPPEQLYEFETADRRRDRYAGDVYLLGSMLFFLFTGVMTTPSVLAKLAPEHRPDGPEAWTGTYEAVKPYLQHAFEVCCRELEDALQKSIPAQFRKDLIPDTLLIFKLSCEPDPARRGYHTIGRSNARNPFDLQWVIARLNMLELRSKILERMNAAAA